MTSSDVFTILRGRDPQPELRREWEQSRERLDGAISELHHNLLGLSRHLCDDGFARAMLDYIARFTKE